jgi:hypothetical protein
LLQQEIDKAIDFSQKAASLVDKIKRKDGGGVEIEDELDQEVQRIESKKTYKPLMPPKQTTLSMQRMVRIFFVKLKKIFL